MYGGISADFSVHHASPNPILIHGVNEYRLKSRALSAIKVIFFMYFLVLLRKRKKKKYKQQELEKTIVVG